jgi:hypothetical protein
LDNFDGYRVFVFEHRVRVVYRIEPDLLTIVRMFGAGRLIDL